MDLKTKGILDNTVSLSVSLFAKKGISPFLNNMSAGMNRYFMDNDLSIAYIAIDKEKKNRDEIVFVFKESIFDSNPEGHLEFVRKFMEELWAKNIRMVFHENVIEKEFPSLNILKKLKSSYDNQEIVEEEKETDVTKKMKI